jgi:hypothetical protein
MPQGLLVQAHGGAQVAAPVRVQPFGKESVGLGEGGWVDGVHARYSIKENAGADENGTAWLGLPTSIVTSGDRWLFPLVNTKPPSIQAFGDEGATIQSCPVPTFFSKDPQASANPSVKQFNPAEQANPNES